MADVSRVFHSGLLLLAAGLFSCNCSKSRPHSDPASASAAAMALDGGARLQAAPGFRCSAESAGSSFSLGSTTGADEDDDSGLDLPFAINVGDAIALDGGYVVAAVDGRGGRSEAVLALVQAENFQGRKLELGRVYGDADPPRLAGDQRRVVVAMADMDAAGRTLSLARVDSPLAQPQVVRGDVISVAHNPSVVFSVAVQGEQGVLVWDQLDEQGEVGQVAVAPFAVSGLDLPKKPTIISERRADSDSPRVLARPGGFWLAWIQAGPPTITKDIVANTKHKPKPEDESLNPVDLGTRELRALALDGSGKPSGKPLHIADGASHVVAYDMGILADGSLLFAWRDDDSAPGVESQVARLARLGLDGHVDYYRIEDESIGVGAPQLLVDPGAGSEDRVWLALINTGERTSLVKLLENGKPSGVVVGDADLGVANPLLRAGSRMLLARQRGKGVDLEAPNCQFAQPVPAR